VTSRKGRVEKAVAELAARICDDKGLELFDVMYRPAQNKDLLRVYVDSTDGVSVEDCAGISKELSMLLDVKDVIRRRYTLEVSSPGLDRPLRHLEDAAVAISKKVKVVSAPIDGRKNFTGILTAVENESLVIEENDERFVIPWEMVKKANLVFEF
jgi:ribosome maturation factor RimP